MADPLEASTWPFEEAATLPCAGLTAWQALFEVAKVDQSVTALRYGGTMSMLGVLTGTRGGVNLYDVFHKRLRVHGVYVGSVAMFER